MDTVHLALTAGAVGALVVYALTQRLGIGARPGASLLGSFATASTVVAVLGFGLLARDCLRSGACAPEPRSVGTHALPPRDAALRD